MREPHLATVPQTRAACRHCCVFLVLVALQTMALNGLISICMFAAVAATMVPPTSALVPFAALTAAVLVHAPFSVGNHLFSCMGAEVHSLWQRCAHCAAAGSCTVLS